MGTCNLCDPPASVNDADLAVHMKLEHGLDLDEVVEKWPDGKWVIHDTTLEPEDFSSKGRDTDG